MARSRRKHLSLLLSTIMLVMMVCQGMAVAALPVPKPIQAEMSVMDCHGDKASAQRGLPDCHSECQQQAKATESGKPSQLPSVTPLLLCTLSIVQADASSPGIAALPLHDPVADPPPLLRFQRFRE